MTMHCKRWTFPQLSKAISTAKSSPSVVPSAEPFEIGRRRW
ncbi:MAG: hypothetical protein ACTS6G_01325 [Candidatus Hodgkinia cicadicola]